MVARRRWARATAIGAVAAILLGTGTVSASSAIRPAPGAPDPRAMVLVSTDLGGARVTGQRYYRDPDFPSVISYMRDFEEGRVAGTPLIAVSSEAEIGTSTGSTAQFVRLLRQFFSSKEGRRAIERMLEDQLGDDADLGSSISIGRPRKLGVGADSFDLPVVLEFLGIRADLHIAVFRVEHVLGNVSALGLPGRTVRTTLMARLAKIMAGRMRAELLPRSTAPPTVAGTPSLGETLTASPGTWSGNPTTFTYAWQRCTSAGTSCVAIPGATGRTHLVVREDMGFTIRVIVTARNRSGTGTAASEPTSVVGGFVDTFSGDRIDPFWSIGTTGSGPTIVQANGQLELTLPASTGLGSGGFANAFALMTCRLSGDFDIQVDYRLLSGLLPIEGINVGLDAAEYSGETYSGQHGVLVHNAGGNNHGIATHFPDPGVYRPPYNDFVSDTALSGTLRLTRQTRLRETRVTASRRHGAPWSFTSLPYRTPTSQAANLYVYANVPLPADVRIAFDNFRISSGELTCSK
ncbi:MAG TPA: hypothetical protein VFU99_00820 [Gaiellaceae bacterium]|nr:hypothetical protein [Gaiellaceae bacterium]